MADDRTTDERLESIERSVARMLHYFDGNGAPPLLSRIAVLEDRGRRAFAIALLIIAQAAATLFVAFSSHGRAEEQSNGSIPERHP